MQWKPIDIEDKELLTSFFASHDILVSDLTFTNLYLWHYARHISWAILNDCLIVKTQYPNENPFIFYPIHKQNNLESKKQTILQLQEICKAKGLTFSIHSLSEVDKAELESLIPDKFDSREQWPECTSPSVNQNRKCDGSYAIALTQTLAERECIVSKDKKMKPLSAQEILSCDKFNNGCRGGTMNLALDYLVKHGVANEECLPYKGSNDVKCEDMCANPEKVKLGNYCILIGEENIKREISKNGPVVSIMQVYSDFLNYKSGVYMKGDDVPRFSGYIAVKILGWGEGDEADGETKQGYWIVQPSWGEDWGEKGIAKVAEKQQFLYEEYAFALHTHEQLVEMQMAAQAAQAAKAEEAKSEDIPDVNLDEEKKD